MIRFLTWLIMKPITSIAKWRAKRKEKATYKRIDRAYTTIARFPKEFKTTGLKIEDIFPIEDVKIRKDRDYYKFKTALWVSGRLHKHTWKRIEKQSKKW